MNCKIDGCKSNSIKRGMCNRHYLQVWRNGSVSARTPFDPNIFIKNDKHFEILLYDKLQREVARAKIDSDDYELVSKYKWCFSQGYPQTGKTSKTGRSLFLHRILNPDWTMTDHISGDKLDNRRINLRECTNQENLFNRGPQKNNTTGFKGVYWKGDKNKFRAAITINGKQIHLGYFDAKKDAAAAYNTASKKCHGEFAHQNEVIS